MPLISWIVVFSLFGSIGAVGGAALLLLFPEGVRKTLVPCLISYATGTLLGADFLGMILRSLKYAQATSVLTAIFIGMILFFLLEKLIIWRHCQIGKCEVNSVEEPLILFGDWQGICKNHNARDSWNCQEVINTRRRYVMLDLKNN